MMVDRAVPCSMLKLGGEAAIINIAPAAAGPIHQTILRSVGLSLRRVQDEFSSSLLPVAPPGGVAQWVRKVGAQGRIYNRCRCCGKGLAFRSRAR
jgi:hypothetical protein